MRPCTVHYVLTVADSITYGRHFYSAGSISDTVVGIIHCFVMNYGITNALHDTTRTLIRRIMCMWFDNLVLRQDTSAGKYLKNANSTHA
jgi:hypothetical protein